MKSQVILDSPISSSLCHGKCWFLVKYHSQRSLRQSYHQSDYNRLNLGQIPSPSSQPLESSSVIYPPTSVSVCSKFFSLFSTAFFILKTSSGLLSASSKNVFVGECQTLSLILHSNRSLISSSVFIWLVFSTAFASSPLLSFLFRLLFVGVPGVCWP